ncbi:MAG TPA: pyridoxamine 5'-phosphate oxidase family protein [Jatrophihabitans sp.]|jgi:hypothetical protein
MYETADELAALDDLLDRSLSSATEHLRAIVRKDERTLTGAELCSVLTGMKTLSLATVTRNAEPRISAVDGHFLHARWVFTTDGAAAKARHLRQRPAASAAHIIGDDFAVFVHGRVEFLDPSQPEFAEVEAHLTTHYGTSPSSWADDIVYLRLQPHWMVCFAADRTTLLAVLES